MIIRIDYIITRDSIIILKNVNDNNNEDNYKSKS